MQFGQTILVLRRLLARIRDVMAGEGSPAGRLGRIVAIIAADMSSEVCSIYIRRGGDLLELFATEGLRQTAVRRTRLHFGEGLIGEIAAKARPLAVADAPSHPKFAYRPETGEEIYKSLMGVPIVRGGRVVGVLAIQNVTARQYADEEIEALQTVAMVLAELVVSVEMLVADMQAAESASLLPERFEGARLSEGLGLGIAVLHSPRFAVRRLVAEDIRIEHERLRTAVSEMHGALDDMLRATNLAAGGEPRQVLETYRMIAEDVGWIRRIGEAINSGLTAEAAVQKVNDDIHARMNHVADEYLKERVHDLEDLAGRLMQHLVGGEEALPELPSGDDIILFARNLGPAKLLEFHRHRLRGVVLEEGSTISHVAIVARALGVPVVGQVREAFSRVENGDFVIVDGDHGQVLVRPREDVRLLFSRSLQARLERRAAYALLKTLPSVTLDGVRIELNMNAGLLVDLHQLGESGADGIGLYRTEVPFMVRTALPTVESQRQLYRKVLDYAAGRPVVFRTLDVGGDKLLPYWDHGDEENPAMGWRAIRVSFDRPAMLRQQLRAFVKAASGEDLNIMFPMIAEVEEFRYAKRLFEKEMERERLAGGKLPRSVRVGVMLEVPSLVFQLAELVTLVDFISIGTNDLFQFLFATDRGNFRISERYDVLSPVVLNLLSDVVAQCRQAGVPVSLCGEMASRPLDAMALIGIGFRSISVAPPAIAPIKAMIRSVTLTGLEDMMRATARGTQRSVRQKLKAYARDHDVAV